METSRAKILIVENQRAIRHPLVTLLRREGYHVDAAENGDRALEKLLSEHRKGVPYDLLTTETLLPGSSGIELINQIRIRGLTLSILVISGYRNRLMTIALREKGCRHFLDKPFSGGKFLQAVNTLVRPEHRVGNDRSKVLFSV